MGRVLEPLQQMGAHLSANNNRLPVHQSRLPADQNLHGIDYTPAHASAQVKSAVLLAALNAHGTTRLSEPRLTRDHTENMLRAFGARLTQTPMDTGQTVTLVGPQTLRAAHVDVPGDPSSAAFLMAAALITPGSDITITNVMMNKTRTGLFEVLVEMGANIQTENFRRSGGESVADIRVRHSQLRAITTPAHIAPAMIDEYPILAVICASADGHSVLNGLAELRVKESDRLSATANLLQVNGVEVKVENDSLHIDGRGKNGQIPGGGLVSTHHDHRIAMSALVLGLIANAPVQIDDASMINTSFPEFFALMDSIGAPIERTP